MAFFFKAARQAAERAAALAMTREQLEVDVKKATDIANANAQAALEAEEQAKNAINVSGGGAGESARSTQHCKPFENFRSPSKTRRSARRPSMRSRKLAQVCGTPSKSNKKANCIFLDAFKSGQAQKDAEKAAEKLGYLAEKDRLARAEAEKTGKSTSFTHFFCALQTTLL